MDDIYAIAKECCKTLNCENCPLRNEDWCVELWKGGLENCSILKKTLSKKKKVMTYE